MIPLRLVPKNLLAHPVRSILTLGSISVATFLLCFLSAAISALDAGVAASSSRRLVVQSAVSLFVTLPLSYQPKIEAVEGVELTCKWQWFGGIYQDRSNFFAQFAVDHDSLLDTYPEIEVIEGSHEDFLERRTACLVGTDLTRRFPEFKVGATLPLIGAIFPRLSGEAWEFEIAGIYESKSPNVDNQTLFFHFDYLEKSMDSGEVGGDPGVGVVVVRIAPEAVLEQVQAAIDERFENGPQRVQTTTEAEFQRQFVSMLGSVPTLLSSIGGAVLFAIFLAVLNTMMMAARERTRDFGILKALGFPDSAVSSLLLVESTLLSVVGGMFGVGLALLTAPVFRTLLGMQLPGYAVTGKTIGLGLAISFGVGFLAAIFPARQVRKLRPVEAFRSEV